jgi:hypothetical protein
VKLGAEKKNQVILLGVLVAIILVVVYMNFFSGGSDSALRPAPVAAPAAVVVGGNAPPVAAPIGTALPDTRRRTTRPATSGEIKFRQGFARPEDRPDPATVNPTLRLDLLAKVQNLEPGGAMRNLFQYGAAPPPAAAAIELPKNPPKIAINKPPVTAPPPPGPPPAPTAPPMTFKYYGYQVPKTDGLKEAFLLDGDDIIVAHENESVKSGRYKVVKIGVNSITIEDTQFKSEQTLQLQVDASA